MADTMERDARANLATESQDAVQAREDYQGP